MALSWFRKGVAGGSDTSVATDSPVDIAAGKPVFVVVTSQEAEFTPATTTGVSDGTNTYVPRTARNGSGGGEYVQIFDCLNPVALTGATITATWSAANRYKAISAQQHDVAASALYNEGSAFDYGVTTLATSGMATSGDSLIIAGVTASSERSFASTDQTVVWNCQPTEAYSHMSSYRYQSGAGTYSANAQPDSAANVAIVGAAYAVSSAIAFDVDPQAAVALAGTFGISADIIITVSQTSSPSSDISTGSWTPSSGVSLYAMLDELSPDDADYITTDTLGDSCEVGLSAVTNPGTTSGHVIHYRLRGDGVSGIRIDLLQDASTVIASWTHDPAPTEFTTFEQTLSGGEAGSIVDYSALRLKFTEV